MARRGRLSNQETAIASRIEIIESSYEYMLAFAAQGRETDVGATQGPSIRETLSRLSTAMIDLDEVLNTVDSSNVSRDFAASLAEDATHARRATELVLSRPRISSQLVDNLNATIHLRSVLTSLFLIDEALNCQNPSSPDQSS